jgi:hypothetical protein
MDEAYLGKNEGAQNREDYLRNAVARIRKLTWERQKAGKIKLTWETQ